MKTAFAIAALLATTISTAAAAVSTTGNTTGGPTWNRTTLGAPPAALSTVGTAVRYEVKPFHVATTGSYEVTVTTVSNWDSYLHIYQGSFNPAAQFTNVLAADDDTGPGAGSYLLINLSAATQYLAVISGFANSDFGAYTLDITGPGSITFGTLNSGPAVPEPASWAMMIAGFGLVGAVARRRRQAVRTA